MKAIISHAHISGCVRQWSRHATPRAFTHLILEGVTGRQFYNHVNTASSDVFVFQLEDWADIPALTKGPEGYPMHEFAGMTRTEQVTPEEFAGQHYIELYIAGHVEKLVNGTDTQGREFIGLKLTDSTFLDLCDQLYVPYRDDLDMWSQVDSRYKNEDGTPRVDVDEIRDTSIISYPEVEE